MTSASNEPGSQVEIVANQVPFKAFIAVPSQGSGPGVLVLDLERLDAEIGREAAHRELADVLRLDLGKIGHGWVCKQEVTPGGGHFVTQS